MNGGGPDLEDPSLYFNRELSWLDFNDRVLQLAEDPSVPLLERVKFAAIWESNLDEVFMVRVANLQDLVDAGTQTRGRRRDAADRDPGRLARARARPARADQPRGRRRPAPGAWPSTESG